MDVPLIVAGTLGLLAAAIHGGAGELLVVRKLAKETLPSTRFGGPGMTRAMIHVSWHLVTVAFLVGGAALLVSGAVLDGDAARACAVVAAGAFTGYAAVALILGIASQSPPSLRALLKHQGPALLALTAVLAWVGAL